MIIFMRMANIREFPTRSPAWRDAVADQPAQHADPVRILAIPIGVATFVTGDYARWFAALFSAAGFTDWLDGHMARRWSNNPNWDGFDPTDKLLVAATLFMLTAMRAHKRSARAGDSVPRDPGVGVARISRCASACRCRASPNGRPIRWLRSASDCRRCGAGPSRWSRSAMLLWIAACDVVTSYDYLRAGLTRTTGEPRPQRGKAQPLARPELR